jgi:hypothetical protein
MESTNQVRRTGIVVEIGIVKTASSVGAASFDKVNYAAPKGLKSVLSLSLQRFRTYGAVLGFILLPSAFTLPASGQTYAIDWHKIAGGGGTISQHDAGGPMTGGNYSLTGGFWALVSVVQTVGLPHLTITHSGNSVIVSWPATGSYTLQQNANLAVASGWAASGYPITIANGTNRITITLPTGNLFFRLAQ